MWKRLLLQIWISLLLQLLNSPTVILLFLLQMWKRLIIKIKMLDGLCSYGNTWGNKSCCYMYLRWCDYWIDFITGHFIAKSLNFFNLDELTKWVKSILMMMWVKELNDFRWIVLTLWYPFPAQKKVRVLLKKRHNAFEYYFWERKCCVFILSF